MHVHAHTGSFVQAAGMHAHRLHEWVCERHCSPLMWMGLHVQAYAHQPTTHVAWLLIGIGLVVGQSPQVGDLRYII